MEKFLDKVCEVFSKKGGDTMKNKINKKEVILKAVNKFSMSMLLAKL